MSTKFVVIVPDSLHDRVLETAIEIRHRAEEAGAGHVYIEVTPDQPDVEDPLKPIGRSTARQASVRPQSATAHRSTSGGNGHSGRTAVVYRPLPGAQARADEVGPAPRRILLYIMGEGRRMLTAADIQAWMAEQDHSTPERVRKSVESSLHTLRTRGLVQSVGV